MKYLARAVRSGYRFAQWKLDECQELQSRPMSGWIKDFSAMKAIETLSESKVSVVELLEDPSTGERITVKSFSKQTMSLPDFGMRFWNKIEMLLSLRHPCVLSIVGYSPRTETRPAQIGTEFAVNGSLRSAIERAKGDFPPDFMNDTVKAIIVCGTAHSMQFIHSHGVMHRDLKPENILLDERG